MFGFDAFAGTPFGAIPSVNGNATASVSGVTATGNVGTITASGDASNNLTGVVSTGSVGTVAASGDSSASVFGVQGSGAVGAITTSGAANTNLTGASSTGAVGTVTATGGTVQNGDAYPTGVQSTGAVGTVTANGGGVQDGNAYPIGVQATAIAGNVTADGGGVPALNNGGFGYPFIVEPDRVIPTRHAVAVVKSAKAIGKVNKLSAYGIISIDANVSVEAILHEIKINSLLAKGVQNPTDEELIALLLMD